MGIGKICMETTTLKRFYPIILLAFFLLNASMITPMSQTARASEYQGRGDWVIDDNTTVTGETIVVYGDVIVKDGGSLTLDHCTLKIEGMVGQNGIEVEKGGELYIYNTTITSNGDLQYYYFDVYGTLMIDGADISKMWSYGLDIRDTKEATIRNSKVHDNTLAVDGIFFSNTTGEVIECNIYNNIRGIGTGGESRVTISNNIITSNYDVGIDCFNDSEVDINNNTISDTYGGIEIAGRGRGINLQGNSKANISNNIIASNYQYGIFCAEDSRANINNNTISDTYGVNGRGVEIQGNSTVSMDNNIITSNMQIGIFCCEDSKVNINSNTVSDTYSEGGNGIEIREDSIVSVANNIITSNSQYGIVCFGKSEVNINSNTISDTYGDSGKGVGIGDNSTVSITNNIITSNKQIGILCSHKSKADIYNNIISKTGGGFGGGSAVQAQQYSTVNIGDTDITSNERGITVLQLASVNIYNSSIINSADYDIWVDESAHPSVINTLFSIDKLHFNDTESIISVGHWVDVNTHNENNTPVQNAEITIKPKDGTEVFDGTTDYNGHVSSIPIVEYDLDYAFTKRFHTPHTVYASKLGRSASEKITVDMDRVVNFTLDISDKLARGNLITTVVGEHDVTVEYSGNGTVSIEPVTKPACVPNATKDIGIFINISAVGDVEDLYITIRYSDNELGKVNEEQLRMYCYFEPGDFEPGDFEPGDFELLEPGNFTGGWVKIKDSGVDIYGNVVWARVSHLTIFAPMAEEVAKPVSKGNVWLLYGTASITSFAILFVAYIALRKKIFRKSESGK